jgi:hypothetical protein
MSKVGIYCGPSDRDRDASLHPCAGEVARLGFDAPEPNAEAHKAVRFVRQRLGEAA